MSESRQEVQTAPQEGYILLHRKLFANPVFQNPFRLKLWIYCLFKAGYKKKRVRFGNADILLEPGQFIWGRSEAAAYLNEGAEPRDIRAERTWENYLKQMEDQGMILREVKWRYTKVTVVNHQEYQRRLGHVTRAPIAEAGIAPPSGSMKEEQLPAAALSFSESEPAGPMPTDSSDPYQMYQKAFACPANEIIAQSIAEWINDFQGNTEIVAFAIEEAGRNGAKNPRYFESVLKSWKKQSIRTLAEAKKRVAEFEAEKERRLSEKIQRLEEEKQMNAACADLPKVSLYNWVEGRKTGESSLKKF